MSESSASLRGWRERDLEEIFEQIVAEKFPNLAKETSVCVQEAEKTPPKVNDNRPTTHHIIVQFTNIRSKDTVLKAAGGKKILTYRGENSRIMSDQSTETWQARRGWQGIFKALSEKNMQPRILYPARLSFRIDGETRTFQAAETERIYDHQTSPTGDIKEGFYKSKKAPRVLQNRNLQSIETKTSQGT